MLQLPSFASFSVHRTAEARYAHIMVSSSAPILVARMSYLGNSTLLGWYHSLGNVELHITQKLQDMDGAGNGCRRGFRLSVPSDFRSFFTGPCASLCR